MTGFEITKEVSDDQTPTRCLRDELEELHAGGKLNNTDTARQITLETLIAARSEMES